MCGILGAVVSRSWWNLRGEVKLSAALGLLKHRGPDGRGVTHHFLPDGERLVVFGHQRLAIFDVSSLGQQPMTDGQGLEIVFNGEILNWSELRTELEQLGHQFITQTDTEVILACYREWGPACVNRFNGFWALGIFDSRASTGAGGQLFLSRDRLGIRPLYYTATQNLFAFSSEIKPLLSLLDVTPRIDLDELIQELVYDQQRVAGRTVYSDVLEFPPGSNALIDLSNLEVRPAAYWELSASEVLQMSDVQALERFSYLLEDSAKLARRCDVEIALTLSGGIDSSAIALACHRAGGAALRAFTSRFLTEPSVDESQFAQYVAKQLNLKHQLVDISPSDIGRNERALARHMEIPYSSFSQLVNWFVAQEIAGAGIKVFMTGQGADELFLGYDRYLTNYFLRGGIGILNRIKEFYRASDRARISAARLLASTIYFHTSRIRKARYNKRYSRILCSRLQTRAEDFEPIEYPFDLRDLSIFESSQGQLQRLLRFDDRIAGAFGLESRPVFLDYRLVEFAVSLEPRHLIRDGWTKFLVRRYLAAHGLDKIAWRKGKLGFPAPSQAWIQTLITLRETSIRKNTVINTYLRPGLELQQLPAATAFKVLMLDSLSREMNWQSLGG